MREIKLKGLHEDEIRCSSDIYETQNQLNLSKIKELEATNFHLQSKIKRCEYPDNKSDLNRSRLETEGEIGGALTPAGANLGGSTSRMHSSAIEAMRRSQAKSQHAFPIAGKKSISEISQHRTD